MIEREITLDELFEKRDDEIHVVTVELGTGRVIGLNLTNRAAMDQTLQSGKCHYYDDVNKVIYLKGEHSGEVELIKEIRLDSCHARRHELHLMYIVVMEEGRCKFGVTDCHFFHFRDGRFIFDDSVVMDRSAVTEFKERIETLLFVDEDREHQKRFNKD